MITLLFWCLLNGFIFHFDPNTFSEEVKMMTIVICVANDLNMLVSLGRK